MKIFTKNNVLDLIKTYGTALLVYALSLMPQMVVVQMLKSNEPALSFFVVCFISLFLVWYISVKLNYLPKPSFAMAKGYLKANNVIYLVILVFGLLVISIMTDVFLDLLGMNTSSTNQETLVFIGENVPFLVFFTMVSSAGFFEELLFRKILYDRLEKINPIYAVISTSVLFSFLHTPTDIGSFISYFASGLYFGILRSKSGKIVPNIVVHAVWNAILVIILF